MAVSSAFDLRLNGDSKLINLYQRKVGLSCEGGGGGGLTMGELVKAIEKRERGRKRRGKIRRILK